MLPLRLSPNCSSSRQAGELLADHPGAAPGLVRVAAVGDVEGDLLDRRAGLAQAFAPRGGRSRRSRHRRRCRRCPTHRRCAGPWRPTRVPRRRARSCQGGATEIGESRLKPDHGVEHHRGVLGGAGQRPVHLAGVPGERHRMVRHESRRRTDADDAAERRRNADRAAEIGALRDRQHAGRDRDRRTARTSRPGSARDSTDCAWRRTTH